MEQVFVDRFMEHKDQIRESFRTNPPESYLGIVAAVVDAITEDDEYNYDGFNPDPDRIHQINDGDYQGTLVFVIGEKGYQPSRYWGLTVSYGSCSGCDTLEAIRVSSEWDDDTDEEVTIVTESNLDDYMSLALHVVQWITKIG